MEILQRKFCNGNSATEILQRKFCDGNSATEILQVDEGNAAAICDQEAKGR